MKQELISTGLAFADFVHRHPKRISAAIAVLLMGGAGGAFAVASLAPTAPTEPLRLVSETVAPSALTQQAEALDVHSFTLYRSEQTRPSDTPEALLKRLGLADRIRHIFSADEMLPAAGQGALGIETIAGRADLASALAPLADQTTWLAVAAERAVSRAMGGSCSMPLAAYATLDGTRLHLRAAWGDPEGAPRLVTAQGAADVDGLDAAVALGERVAAELRAAGAH